MVEGFKERLKKARKSKDFTQEGLAKALGWPVSKVGHYESGHRTPSLANLRDLCATLEVRADYLMGLTPYKTTGEEAEDLARNAIYSRLDRANSQSS